MAVVPTIYDIREITPLLKEVLNIDLYNFTLSFLRRRFASVFNQLNIKSVEGFKEDIKKGKFIDEFSYAFSVPDTEMFRDPSFWRTLKNKIFPQFGEKPFNIWMPDLVSNEELFSLLVILEQDKLIDQVKIYCNVDCSLRLLELKKGSIDGKSIEISMQNFKRLELDSQFEDYFTYDNKSIYIKEELLKNIEYIKGNYFVNGPTENISFCLYRNRMIYFNLKLQQSAEEELLKYIEKGGFLALGIKEKISQYNRDLFDEVDSNEQIYKA